MAGAAEEEGEEGLSLAALVVRNNLGGAASDGRGRVWGSVRARRRGPRR